MAAPVPPARQEATRFSMGLAPHVPIHRHRSAPRAGAAVRWGQERPQEEAPLPAFLQAALDVIAEAMAAERMTIVGHRAQAAGQLVPLEKEAMAVLKTVAAKKEVPAVAATVPMAPLEARRAVRLLLPTARREVLRKILPRAARAARAAATAIRARMALAAAGVAASLPHRAPAARAAPVSNGTVPRALRQVSPIAVLAEGAAVAVAMVVLGQEEGVVMEDSLAVAVAVAAIAVLQATVAMGRMGLL